jgi:rod shape-determining protein MreC
MLWRLPARWRRVLTVALVPLAALLAAVAGGVPHFAAGVAVAAAPLQAGAASALSGVGSLLGVAGLRRENEELRRELDQLRRELQESRERLAAADRLERLLDYRERSGFTVAAASVIGRDASGLYRTVLIDRGGADGVASGQAVLAPDGVVGRVIRAYPRSALVLLLTDRSSGIDAIVQRTRDQGVVRGRGGATCELQYLDRSSEVEIGDTIVTSGMGGGFPKGVWLGRVSAVDRGGEMFLGVDVRPTADLAHLEEVLVVTEPGR